MIPSKLSGASQQFQLIFRSMTDAPRSVVICLVFLGVSFASVTLSDDFKTVNGKEYKNATISRVEPDGIMIAFSGGIVKIPFTEVSKEVQERFHYHCGKAAQFNAAEQAAVTQSNAGAACRYCGS
jgi:hypothetical protein